MKQELYIIDKNDKLKVDLEKSLTNMKIKEIQEDDIDNALRDIPALIIINEDNIDGDIVELCTKIRDNEDNKITPVIVVSSNTKEDHALDLLKNMITYFITIPVNIDILSYIIKNTINLLYMNRKVSPLTNLPGNVQIQAEMKKRLLKKENFAMFYLDLDNFKAYNDVYGFSNGDEVIKFTARVIVNNIHKNDVDNNFVGHIGGDDFIAIVENDDYEKICQDIIAEFEKGITKYFSEEDIKKGYLEVPNRKGVLEQFPITSISIGVVEVDESRFSNTLEIGEVGAQVKHLSKTIPGSTYVINRRRD